MRRRWAPAALVAFVLLLSSIRPQSFAREMAAQSKTTSNSKKKRPISPTAATLTTKGLQGCKPNKQCARCDCSLVGHQEQKNSSSLDDDKRVVPTGPNPLHNR